MTAMANQFQWIYLSCHFIKIIINVLYIYIYILIECILIEECMHVWVHEKYAVISLAHAVLWAFVPVVCFHFLWLIKIHSVYIKCKTKVFNEQKPMGNQFGSLTPATSFGLILKVKCAYIYIVDRKQNSK